MQSFGKNVIDLLPVLLMHDDDVEPRLYAL